MYFFNCANFWKKDFSQSGRSSLYNCTMYSVQCNGTLDEIRVITRWVKKKNRNWSIQTDQCYCYRPRKTPLQSSPKTFESTSLTEKNRKLLKAVGSRPGAMYGFCKIHRASVEHCPPFRTTFSALNSPTYKRVNCLVPILKRLKTNEFTIKDSLHFAEEIIDQQPDVFMGSLDVDSLFTNIAFEKTIEICTNWLFKESETVEG